MLRLRPRLLTQRLQNSPFDSESQADEGAVEPVSRADKSQSAADNDDTLSERGASPATGAGHFEAPELSPVDKPLFESTLAGFYQCALDGRFLNANLTLVQLLGFESVEDFLKQGLNRNELYVDSESREEYAKLIEDTGQVREFESQVSRFGRSAIWVEENAHAVRNSDGVITHVEGMMQSIDRRKQREEQLLRHAFHDKLTDLPDRTLFLERMERCIKRRARRQTYWFAVLFLDLDRFKIVNDSLGHSAGDELLIATARQLEKSVRPGDTVARLGGDEFAILLDDVKDISDATRVAERVLHLLSIPVEIGDHEIHNTASIGIALVSQNYERPDELLRDADRAMYRAKASGKARYTIFDSTMYSDGRSMLQMEADLRHALEKREFHVAYQPVVSLGSGMVEGFEAFVRWQHPTRGLVPPSEFVPLAEETGVLVQIDRWILSQACRQMVAWQEQFPMQSLLTMNVNLSSRQFSQSDLVEEIEKIIRRSGLPPRCLRLEMTEKSLLANPDSAAVILESLKALDLQISLDDFGTGYSSLAHLHRFAFDALKIDQSFIGQMDDPKFDEIVRAIVNIAHNLRIAVVAEGVETEQQLTRLRELKCHYAQGYLFSGALDAEAASELLTARSKW